MKAHTTLARWGTLVAVISGLWLALAGRPALGGPGSETLKDGTKVEIEEDHLFIVKGSARKPAKDGTYTLSSGRKLTVKKGVLVPVATPTAAPVHSGAIDCLKGKQLGGLGCKETPPAVWRAQGCFDNQGCCAAATGCWVQSSVDPNVAKDGIY